MESNEVITGALWDHPSGAPDAMAHRYFDQVLARVHWDLCSTRCSAGMFECAANANVSEDQLLPVFNPGSLALWAETTSHGYPVTGDLSNTAGVMAGTISGVLKKLHMGNCDGIGFVYYGQNPDHWGYPAEMFSSGFSRSRFPPRPVPFYRTVFEKCKKIRYRPVPYR